MRSHLRLHLASVATLLTLLLSAAFAAPAAQASSTYSVAVCGYNAAGGQAGGWSDLNPGPAALSICYLTDASGGTQGAGATDNAIFSAPANEAITAVSTAYSHYWTSHTSADDYWSVGLGWDISGNNAVYFPQFGDCSNNASSHIYTYSGANSLTSGCNNTITTASLGGQWAYNVGLIAVCHASACPSDGGSGASIDGLIVNLNDPYTTPAIGAGGSLWNAANGSWISGLNDGSSLAMSYYASDPGTVCALNAELVDSSGNAAASSSATEPTNWNGGTWADSQPCNAEPSGTLAPNLASLQTGTYYLNATAQNPGNVQGGGASWASGGTWTQGRVLRVDNSPPSGALSTNAKASAWYATPQTVTVNASDVGSGVNSVDCTGPGAPSSAIPASQLPYTITVSQNGSDTITCDAVDNAGNITSIGSTTINIDQTVPTASLTSNEDPSTWYASPSAVPAVTVSTTSGPSGIASITCHAPGVLDTLSAASGTVDLTGLRDGADTITCTPMNPAGVSGAPATLALRVDSQVPTVSFSGHASQTAWYASAGSVPALDADATTGPSGLASIGCSGDGIATQSALVSGASVTLTGLNQGTGAITCTATSVSGLTSLPQAFTLNLDSAAPSATWDTTQSQTTWYPSSASVPTLGISATPGGPSGVDHITCSGAGFSSAQTIQGATGALRPTGFPDGTETITCVPVSGAGVSGPAVTRTVLVDSTAPAVALSGTASGTWYPSAQTVNADATSDSNPSGVQSISCSSDGNAATTTNGDHASQAVSGDGVHTVACHAVSGAGVAGAAQTTAVRIDSQTPTVTQSVVPAGPAEPTGTVAVLVNAAESNPLSGIASTSCSLDHQTPTVVQGDKQTVAATSAGQHTLVCSATTRAGVVSADSTRTYTVASDPSQFSLQYGTVPTSWQSGPVTVPVKLTGATAQNYSSLTCTVGSGAPTSISGTSGTVHVTKSGTQQLACYATANDGASTAALTQTVKIDEQTPTAAWSASSTPTGEQLSLLGSEQTPLSGVASESCSVDGGAAQSSDTPHLTVVIDGNGTHTADCAITSGAGLTAHVSHTVNVSVPVPAPTAISAPDPGRWYSAAQSIVLGIPAGGPAIASVRCTQAGQTTSYPVSAGTVKVDVPAPGGDVRCLDVDDSGSQSTTVDFPVHIDTSAPTGYFLQTGPRTAVLAVSNPGGSGIQGVSVQYRVGGAAWVTIPGAPDPSSGEVAVSLPAALRQPGVQYALRAIAVNNAGSRTTISTMKNGAAATGTAPNDPAAAAAAVSGGLYLGTVPPGGRIRVAKMVPSVRRVRIRRHGRTVIRRERLYRTVTKRVVVHGRTRVRRVKVPRMRRTYVWKINTATLAHTLTVRHGQAVNLAGTLSLSSGQLAGQTVTIVESSGRTQHRLTATTDTGGNFTIHLGAGPTRTITYTVDGISRTVRIRVHGKITLKVVGRGARRRTLKLVVAGATGPVAYRLQRAHGKRWRTVGRVRHTHARGRAVIHLPAALAGSSLAKLRVLVRTQRTWRYLGAEEHA